MARFSGSGGGEGTPGPEGPAGPPGADANTGDITFDGIQIIGAGTASGDGLENGTIDLVPDGTLETDQYLIIDPTAPNHIHIRAGGTQDESSSDLFLGGERNNVRVSDNGRDVVINVRPAPVINSYTNANPTSNTNFIISNTANIYVGDTAFASGGDTVTIDSVTQDSPSAGLQTVTGNLNGTPAQFVGGAAHVFIHEESWNHSWLFNDDGYLTGPAMGGLFVSGLLNGEGDLWLGSSDYNVILNPGPENSAYLGDASTVNNQIATIGDINNTVSAITSYSPVWSGTGLAFTGTPATGTYIKIGNLVQVQLDVIFTNVTNFGSGQYSLTLPLPSKYHTDVFGGSIHNTGSPTDHYSLKGHLLPTSSAMTLWYIAGSSQDQIFDHNSPISLNTTDKFHMSFSYICE